PARRAPAVAFPDELRGDRGPGVDDAGRGRGLRSLAAAGTARDSRRPDATCARRDAVARSRGDRALPRLRPRGRGDARRHGAGAPLVPRRDRRRPGPPPSRGRYRAHAARPRRVQPRLRPLRAPHEQRGEPRLLRAPWLRGDPPGPDAGRRASRLDDAPPPRPTRLTRWKTCPSDF